MKRFTPPPEPVDFDAKVRQPGLIWLAENPDKSPKNLWSFFRPNLAKGFQKLCGYTVMFTPNGTVDHYLSQRNYRSLAYEWSNMRYAAGWINSSKGTQDDKILDPFQVEDDWFEILLPSLQLVLTDAVPPHERERAEYTLKHLHLIDDHRVIEQREQWYDMYVNGQLNLDGLEELAPLIARAIRKQQNQAGR